MSSPTPEPTLCPPGFHPNGLVTVASLGLAAFLSVGFGPGGPPPGFLDSLTYSAASGRLSITFPPDLLDDVGDKIDGGEYKEQPIVGWKDGIDTRPGDYVGFDSSSHPFVPGAHPLAEAATDERLVGTNWLSHAESEEMFGPDVERVEAQPLPAGYRWPSDDSLPSTECGCPDCRSGGAEEGGP